MQLRSILLWPALRALLQRNTTANLANWQAVENQVTLADG
jgi:hypothetical protein